MTKDKLDLTIYCVLLFLMVVLVIFLYSAMKADPLPVERDDLVCKRHGFSFRVAGRDQPTCVNQDGVIYSIEVLRSRPQR